MLRTPVSSGINDRSMRHLKRRSIRLKGYDYSRPGAYYITLCTNGREPLFGEIKNGEMILNDPGKTVAKCWNEIPAHFLSVTTDAFVIMPDHVHGILFIDSVNTTTGADDICVMADDTNVGANNYSPLPLTVSCNGGPRNNFLYSYGKTITHCIGGYAHVQSRLLLPRFRLHRARPA